jgi:sugar-specific transcriptional regulator TrmB
VAVKRAQNPSGLRFVIGKPPSPVSRKPRKMENVPEKIPAELAKELRKLAHDLSNALETIVQATYLISQAGPPENSRRWVEMIDEASQEAVRINQRLRQVLRQQS